MRLSVPKPVANTDASSGGDVAGVIAAKLGSGGVLLNRASGGTLPCDSRAVIPVVLGSRVVMPVAYFASKISVVFVNRLPQAA